MAEKIRWTGAARRGLPRDGLLGLGGFEPAGVRIGYGRATQDMQKPELIQIHRVRSGLTSKKDADIFRPTI